MSRAARRHLLTEGHRGARIDLEEEAAIWVSPEMMSVRAFTTVQRTGCGTPGLLLSAAIWVQSDLGHLPSTGEE